MLHLDLTVPNKAELDAAHQRALALGAQVLMNHSDDEEGAALGLCRPRRPPICIFVHPGRWWLSHHHSPGERA
jgi:hypothetical protein